MEQSSPFDTLLICGVPVLQWRAGAQNSAIVHCRQIVQSLARNGYREMVFDLHHIAVSAPRDVQRLLNTLERLLPAHTHVEIVLPAGSPVAWHPRRLRIAPSVALALSHITRLPVASLQGFLATHVCWREHQG